MWAFGWRGGREARCRPLGGGEGESIDVAFGGREESLGVGLL